LNSAVAIGCKPLPGWTADHFGPKRTLVVAVFLGSLVSLLLVYSSAPWQLFAIRSLHGISMAAHEIHAAGAPPRNRHGIPRMRSGESSTRRSGSR
jgi:MFS family permease